MNSESVKALYVVTINSWRYSKSRGLTESDSIQLDRVTQEEIYSPNLT